MGLTAARHPRPLGQWPDVLLITAAIVLCWTLLPAVLQTVPHADNVEQLNWSHALDWGYLKHPPLPTALLWAASSLVGPSATLTYLLAMLCVGATLLLLWRCALLLADRPTALLAMLLCSTNYYLMGRGSFLNHNTVMLPFVAASALLVLRIVGAASGRGTSHLWVLLGLVQALGLLTKYQMAIVIAANGAALLACVPWRLPGRALPFFLHAVLCAAATVAPLIPHYLWLQQHDFSTFTYAGQNLLAALPLGARLVHTLGFVAQQIGRLAPVGICLGLALLLQRLRRPVAAQGPSGAAEADRAATASRPGAAAPAPALLRALWILAVVPIGIVLALAVFGGVALQNHWGASSTVLLPLLLAVTLRPSARPAAGIALAAAAGVHAAAVLWNIVVALAAPGFHHSFAARPLAELALAHWQAHEKGPLRIVVGPDWDAGAIALELPSHPAVMASGDRRQAPWITDAQIAGCGALVLWRPGQPPEDQLGREFAARITERVILQEQSPRGSVSTIAAGILAPTGTQCPEASR
jgi:4-amino-4-deoxy-L-arabinose transferase-like glycosyltransferase